MLASAALFILLQYLSYKFHLSFIVCGVWSENSVL